jgi:RNA polymerase primary sigma factor
MIVNNFTLQQNFGAKRPSKPSIVMSMYSQDVKRTKLITPEAEVVLAQRIKNGDSHAINELVTANLRFAISRVKQYVRYGHSLPDLIQQGNIGLIKAAETFDPTLGKFSTHARHKIRGEVTQYIREESRAIKVPEGVLKIKSQLRKTTKELTKELLRLPTEEELAAKMEITVSKLREIQADIVAEPVSLDMPIGVDKNHLLSDIIKDENAEIPFQEVDFKNSSSKVNDALEQLAPQEAQVVKSLFGIDDEGNEHSLREIADSSNIPVHRLKVIRDRAFRKLKLAIKQDEVEGCLER